MTAITFKLPYAAIASLKAYNIMGREVATLAEGRFAEAAIA